MNEKVDVGALEDAIERARSHSPFLGRLIETREPLVACLRENGADATLRRAMADGEGDPRQLVRIRREGVALVIALCDLAGISEFPAIVSGLSDFADQALENAIETVFADRCGEGAVSGFAAIALGKHGSRELNYSSDIDLLFLVDPETLPCEGGSDAQRLAVRMGRDIVDFLQERTADGYAFRVDLRLRPSPEVTPIALPVNSAISYYESNAEQWERAAFIRARAVGGDVELGQSFLTAIEPFVWRRALDFGTIGEIRAISRRIRDHYATGQKFGPGYDIKRGRGGIREIEFFAQIQQLIHGGRDSALRAPATLAALAALADAGHIAADEASKLADAYRLFRTIEHRLQMIDDRQTHSLPQDAESLNGVAQLHGLSDGEALLAALREPIASVESLYDDLTDDDEERAPSGGDALERYLQISGFVEAADARRRIEGWRDGKQPTTRSPAARAALEAILPELLRQFGGAPDSIAAINRFDTLLSKLPSAINFFRLLEARPGLVQMLADILSHAPALADELARRAELFDGLLDATALDLPEPVEELVAILAKGSADGDYQARLDKMRQLVGEERFALGVQIIEGRSDPLDVAAGYSRVAEASLNVLTHATIAQFEERHGRVPGSELVIVGLGRLGGEALTHASDLDLVYLFTGDHRGESDGHRPLGATSYFQRLAQRVTAALSVPTAAGPLYEIDTRLRPSGNQGLLAVSLASFAEYHRTSSWTWEQMALARARPVFGSPDARAAVDAIIAETLERHRDHGKTRVDATEMRAEIAQHKRPAGPLDVKLVEGGLVDLEFCVHTIQLCERAGFDPHLSEAIDTLVDEKLMAAEMRPAHDLLTRMLVTLRLVAPGSGDVPAGTRSLVAQACRCESWDALMAAYESTRDAVRREWNRIRSG